MAFKQVTKRRPWARIAIIGPTGSGKTWTALEIASGLAGPNGRIAMGDTERGTATLYRHRFVFDPSDVFDGGDYSPTNYMKVIREAVDARYDVLVLDSISHAWMGPGGVIEMVDIEKERGNKGLSPWGKLTPLQNEFVDAMLSAPIHLIVTMRSKMTYVQEDEEVNGRKKVVVRKVGLQPVQRDGIEYEWDLVGDMSESNDFFVTKSRYDIDALRPRKTVRQPDRKVGETIRAWLDAELPQAPSLTPAAPPKVPEVPMEAPGKGHAPSMTKAPLRVVDTAPEQPQAPASTHAPDDKTQVRADLDAFAEMLGGWEQMLATVGETERPKTLHAARALLIKVRTAQAEAVGEKRAEHGTF